MSQQGFNWRGRIKAMLVHFLATASIAGLAALLIFGVWYPSPFHLMLRGLELFGLIVACDVALGPLISLVIYNIKKPRSELIRDYIIVGLVQIAMLGYGMYAVALGRPAVVTYTKGLFKVLTASEIDQASLAKAKPPYHQLGWTGNIMLVSVKKPESKETGGDVLANIASGMDWENFPVNYEPYLTQKEDILKRAETLQNLLQKRQNLKSDVDLALKKVGRGMDSVVYMQLAFRSDTGIVLLDAKTAEILGYFLINPL